MFNNPLRIVSPGREKEAGREATKDRIEGWFARKRDTLEYFFNGEPRKKDLQPREERDSLERSGTGSGGTWQKPNPDCKSHRNNVNESSSYADSSSLCLSLSHAYVPIVCTVSKKKKRKRGREQANRGMFFLTTDGERGREKERERERENSLAVCCFRRSQNTDRDCFFLCVFNSRYFTERQDKQFRESAKRFPNGIKDQLPVNTCHLSFVVFFFLFTWTVFPLFPWYEEVSVKPRPMKCF